MSERTGQNDHEYARPHGSPELTGPTPAQVQAAEMQAWRPYGGFATRSEQRVHQVAWALFLAMISVICTTLTFPLFDLSGIVPVAYGVLTAITIVGGFVFAMAAIGLWIAAFVLSIKALRRN